MTDWIKAESGQLVEAITRAERSAVAATLNLIDDRRPEKQAEVARLFEALETTEPYQRGHVVGITGPPGAGKSSLASAMVDQWLKQGFSVGIIAIDPSSPFSGGALLGDRLRMTRSDPAQGLFIRSLSSRGEKGGLSPQAWPMSRVLLAGYDIVIIETVGVGQSEIDVANMADTTCLVVQPGSGDTIQFLKAGIMEIPDIIAVNKADLGQMARTTADELRLALPQVDDSESWEVSVEAVSASHHTGIDKLAETVLSHRGWLEDKGLLEERRKRAEAAWGIKRLLEQFGAFGLDKLGGDEKVQNRWLEITGSPFEKLESFKEQLVLSWK